MKTEALSLGHRRPIWIEIDLDNLEYNFRRIKEIVGDSVKVMATVKSDAYGHGLLEVSRRLVLCGVDFLGVGDIEEGIRLREFGIKNPILILGSILAQQVGPILEYDLSLNLCVKQVAEALNRKAKGKKRKARVHIKVDTGMGRLGIWHRQALEFVRYVAGLTSLEIEGIYTHLSCAEEDAVFTNRQIALFNSLLDKIQAHRIKIPYTHVANSAGLIMFPQSHFNLVRPGLIIYGLYPRLNLSKRIDLKPVLSLKARIIYLKSVPAGRTIGYGKTYITPKETLIATVPIGYGDGYPRSLSNKAKVLLRGRRMPVIGRICMDQMMIDVGEIKDVEIGEEVTAIGKEGKERITIEELANLSKTIPYEIACSVGLRIPRLYKKDKKIPS